MHVADASCDRASMVTPCSQVCIVHPVNGSCIGCGRTVDEIARWTAMSEAERRGVMAALPHRLAAMRGGAVLHKG